MNAERFEDLLFWQKSRKLVRYVYRSMANNRDFGFRDQYTRAAVSVMNNIAEGFERQTNKEFRQFLFIAKGSCGEVRSMCYAACDLEYISKDEFDRTYNLSLEISRMVSSFIKRL